MATISQAQLLEQARRDLDNLRPRIAVIEVILPKMMTCIERLHKTSQDPEADIARYMAALCQACMVTLESQYTSLTTQLEEMKKLETNIVSLLESSSRMVTIPGVGRNVIS